MGDHRHSVLLVEDHDDTRDAMTLLIEFAGFRVASATNGLDALEQLKRMGLRPCLILLDLMMPLMDGFAFRRVQLANPDIAAIPVAVTSIGGLDTEDEAKRLGMVAYLRKPFEVPTLLRVLEQHCAAREGAAGDGAR